jgi:hypothetical protein
MVMASSATALADQAKALASPVVALSRTIR